MVDCPYFSKTTLTVGQYTICGEIKFLLEIFMEIPGDKSITHRAMLFGAMATGKTIIKRPLKAQDTLSTAQVLSQLGINIEWKDDIIIHGGTFKSGQTLYCGNSGTTARLLTGLLCAREVSATLTGDQSLSKRPMKRVSSPLNFLGADISTEETLPLFIKGKKLLGKDIELNTPSAQVKSAVIFVLMQSENGGRLTGKVSGRDHTERMIPYFEGKIEQNFIPGNQKLKGQSLAIPGDISSAAYFIADALLQKKELVLENIGLNPTRLGFINVLIKMGALIEFEAYESFEPYGRIIVRPSNLHGTIVDSAEIPSLIDEIPLLSVVATQAEGKTTIHGVEELKFKESDRLAAIINNLAKMKASAQYENGKLTISGNQRLSGAKLDSYHDHRIIMSFLVAAKLAKDPCEILGKEWVNISFPNFKI